MAAFVPRMGRRYENGRNTDHGPGAHKAVSVLSPYVNPRDGSLVLVNRGFVPSAARWRATRASASHRSTIRWPSERVSASGTSLAAAALPLSSGKIASTARVSKSPSASTKVKRTRPAISASGARKVSNLGPSPSARSSSTARA